MGKQSRQKQTATSARRVRRTAWIGGAIALAALGVAGIMSMTGRSGDDAASSPVRAHATGTSGAESTLPVVHVYKSPSCECCSKWVDHLREEGFEVRTTDMHDLTQFKTNHGVPPQLQSCHTALVAGYVLEGHVPGADIRRLLQERPAIAGLAVAGMPIGSPGMEVDGRAAQPYEVIAFRNDGRTEVFARHGGEAERRPSPLDAHRGTT